MKDKYEPDHNIQIDYVSRFIDEIDVLLLRLTSMLRINLFLENRQKKRRNNYERLLYNVLESTSIIT
jgi:hypothetical protein